MYVSISQELTWQHREEIMHGVRAAREAGTARSTTSKSDLPVTRSNRKTYPVFVTCAAASTFRPLCFTVTSTGGEGRS